MKQVLVVLLVVVACFLSGAVGMLMGKQQPIVNVLPWPMMGKAMGSDPVRAAEFVRSTYDGYSDAVISSRLLCCESIRVRMGNYLSTVAQTEHLEQITLIGYLHFLRPDRLQNFRAEIQTLAEKPTRPDGSTFPHYSLFFGGDVVAAAQYALSAIPPEK